MKNNLINKDFNYSLHNIENYKKELSSNVNEIIINYVNLLIEYCKFIIENVKIKNNPFSRFIIIRGIDTLTNVFLNLLLYTKNLDLTYLHCQKSFYFYVEFVGQISEDEKMFLQLTSRDASAYVYKKTIFEINNNFKKFNENLSISSRDKFELVNVYVSLYKSYLLKILEKNDFSKNEDFIILIEEIANKLNNVNNSQIQIEKIKLFENVVDKLLNNIEEVTRFFELNKYLVKKFIKNNNILDNCHKKIVSEDFSNKIKHESNEKFMNWLLS